MTADLSSKFNHPPPKSKPFCFHRTEEEDGDGDGDGWWIDDDGGDRDDYRKTSNISRTLVGNKVVDNSDVVGAAPTTSSFSI